jgi:hypothetical protein
MKGVVSRKWMVGSHAAGIPDAEQVQDATEYKSYAAARAAAKGMKEQYPHLNRIIVVEYSTEIVAEFHSR